MFVKMDQQLIEALCCCLKRVFYTIIVRELIKCFHRDGKYLNYKNHKSGRKWFLQQDNSQGWRLFLGMWAMDSDSSSSLPNSTRTLRAVDNVEAFTLTRDDFN